jgi:hypothetical protein
MLCLHSRPNDICHQTKQPVEKVPDELRGGREEFARAELLFERDRRAKDMG